MSAVKKERADDLAAYKLAAVAMRKKFAASGEGIDPGILPVNGKIRVVLNGPPIPPDKQDTLFGESAISFPMVKLPPEKTD